MKNKLYFTLTLLAIAVSAFAQNSIIDVGLEVQAYPTGIISGVRFEKSLNKRDLWTVRLGYQLINHGNQGKHDDEKGSGFGGTAGFKHYFERYFIGPNLGAREDFWRNNIDWTTNADTGTIKGNSEIQVVQPTIEFGWGFLVGEDFVLTPAAAFGFEINVRTAGEETGEGAILLVGITGAYRLQ